MLNRNLVIAVRRLTLTPCTVYPAVAVLPPCAAALAPPPTRAAAWSPRAGHLEPVDGVQPGGDQHRARDHRVPVLRRRRRLPRPS
eukprot:scaffold23728_cov129-Isochrysis_galbana.AAC.2